LTPALVRPQLGFLLTFVTLSMVNLTYTLVEPSGGGSMSTVGVHWFDRMITSILFAIDRWDPTDQEVLEQFCGHGFGTTVQSAPDGHRALPVMAIDASGMQA
jgi:hypothetical protein